MILEHITTLNLASGREPVHCILDEGIQALAASRHLSRLEFLTRPFAATAGIK